MAYLVAYKRMAKVKIGDKIDKHIWTATDESIRLGNLCTSYSAIIADLEERVNNLPPFTAKLNQCIATITFLKQEQFRVETKYDKFNKKHFPDGELVNGTEKQESKKTARQNKGR